MRNIYSFLTDKFLAAVVLAGCMTIISCSDDKELTVGMPESQLINAIKLEVSPQLSIAVGMDTTIVYSITPKDAAETRVIWSSSNEKIATVSPNGTITGLAEGEAVITVMPILGFGVTNITLQSVEVKVIPEIIKATSIEFTNKDDQGNPVTELYQTDNMELTYNILPADHTYSYITWKSGDESLVTVDENGEVTGIAPGDVTIYAYTNDHSGVVGKYDLKILPYIPAENVTVKTHNEKLHMYQEVMLDYRMTPSEATASTIKWSSSDESVVTVKKGKITAVGFGTAIVTAQCLQNDNTSSTTITVDPGWWIWDARNSFKDWQPNSSYASGYVVENGKLTVTLKSATKWRGDIQFVAKTKAFHAGKYPIIAIKCSFPDLVMNGINLDVADPSGAVRSNCGGKKNTRSKDNMYVYYWNMATGYPAMSTTALTGFNTFQIKLADLPDANLPEGKYDVYWIRTFTSEAELLTFINNENNAD